MSLVGQTIDHYHILERLGQGGMAVVYKATDTRLDREVAIKIIRRAGIPDANYAEFLERFKQEAKVQARFNHPNIVKVHDYGNHKGAPYLALEYLRGGTLESRTGAPMPFAQAAALLAPISSALAYAHARNVLHRDVKPGNILIDERGIPLLTDFGIVKMLGGDRENVLTDIGKGIGTPEYMAPEQWHGESGPQTDIYALGVVLYELVTGKRPYTANTPQGVGIRQATEPLPPPRQFAPNLSEAAEQIILKALAFKSEERYASMADFEARLSAIPMAETVRDFKSTLTVMDTMGLVATDLETPAIEIEGLPDETGANNEEGQAQVHARRKFAAKFGPWGWALAALGPLMLCAGTLGGLALRELLPEPPVSPTATAGLAAEATDSPPATETAAPPPPPSEAPAPTDTPTLDPGAAFTNPADGAQLRYIPAGEFLMGSEDGAPDERPVHTVYLDDYWMYETEVTNAQYRRFVADTGYDNRGDSILFGLDQHPAVDISWNEAVAYCEWAGMRLPTEAEWERAARGDDGRTFPWGNVWDGRQANSSTDVYGFERTAPVGSFPAGASPFGLLDMAGNVWEWVADYYASDSYANSPASNPTGPVEGASHILRGGSWAYPEFALRTSNRYDIGDPSLSAPDFGFRCASSEEP